jgi:tight adherence protein B
VRRVAGVAALVVVAATLSSGTGAALAATPPTTGPPLTLTSAISVRRVDTTAFPTVRIDAVAEGGSSAPAFTLTENAKAVSGVKAQTWQAAGRPIGTVLVIDTAASMVERDKLLKSQAAAKDYIAHKPGNELIAIVAAGPTPRVVVNFTADAGALDNAVNDLIPEGEQALYDALRVGSGLLTDRPELLANVIVVSDRADSLSNTKGSQALAALGDVHASVFTVGLPGNAAFDGSVLRALAGGGGQYLQVADPTGVQSAFTLIHGALARGTELTYTSKSKANVALDISVTARGQTLVVHTVAGAVAAGSNATPASVHLRQAPGPLKNKLGVLTIALMVLAAAGLFAYAVLALATTDKSSLESALKPYYQDGGISHADEDDDGSVVQTAFVARAVAATGRFAEQQGVLERVETMLEQADLALRPAEALFFYLAGVLLLTVLVVFTKGPILGFVALLILAMIPPAFLSFLATRRLRQFTAQLPDTLQLLSSSLRAGFSFLQGVEAVATESKKPMGDELRRVIIEARLGRPVEEALQDCADRMKSKDFDWAVMAVRIQREVGGNLAELLQTVGETMVERERLRRDVKSLTAEGRVSAIVLGIMPPALGAVFYVTNPSYMKVLFTHVGGQVALAVAVVAMLIGFVWMKKIVDIEV